MRLEKRASVVGIKTSGLGIDRHSFERRPTIRSESGGKTARRAQRGFVYRETPARRFGVMRLNPRPPFVRPIHWPDVKRSVRVEPPCAFVCQYATPLSSN